MSSTPSTGQAPVDPSIVQQNDPRQYEFHPYWQRPEAIRNELGLLTEPELALALQVTVETLATWRGLGQGPKYTKPGKQVFYRCEDVKAWIDAHVHLPAGKRSVA